MENQGFTVLPRLKFTEAVRNVLNNVTNFKGRSRRSEYWWYMLATCIVNTLATMFFGGMSIIYAIIAILVALSTVAVAARRMQDSGHSPIWVYVDFVSSMFLLIYMFASGYYEVANSANPNPEKLVAIVSSVFFWLPALIAGVSGFVMFIFSLFDSDKATNKYGASPKYVTSEKTIED